MQFGLADILLMLGGLGLFLYGMRLMGDGLELAAGSKLKKLLSALTTNRLMGVLVGFLVTAVIQSSSATTVMVIGFVNAGLMTLSQAAGVIMGANIGTTITGQLIALDVGAIAPLFAFIGVVLVVFIKKQSVRYCGQIIAGLGILFIGMNTMSSAVEPLKNLPEFQSVFTAFSNPLLGVAVGAAVTALFLVIKRPMLYLFGASDATYPYADAYMTIYLMGTLFVMIGLGMNPFINAQGFSRMGMMTVALGAAVNIVLDPIFIFALDMGVRGAALATVLAQGCSALWVLKFLTDGGRSSGCGGTPCGSRRREYVGSSPWAPPALSCP